MKETFVMEKVLRLAAAKGSATGHPLLLAMVLATEGSTYQKAGACALLQGSRVIAGLVSGGCLEEDLAKQAEGLALVQGPVWLPIRYDTRSDEDDVFGTALGCRGLIEVALIPMQTPGLLELLKSFWNAASPWSGRVVVDSLANLILEPLLPSTMQIGDHPVPSAMVFESLEPARTLDGRCLPRQDEPLILSKRRSVVVCGAGPDAAPLVGLLLECGCEVVVVDHRPEQLDILQHWLATRDLRDPGLCLEWSSPFLPELAVRLCLARTAWQQELVHAKPSAVIIMSHHLDWDARYLEAFYAAGFDASSCYLGLLGPNHRSKSVVARLPERFRAFDAGLHSPMGLDLKARGPAAIAVSVVAELLRFWNSRSLGVNHR